MTVDADNKEIKMKSSFSCQKLTDFRRGYGLYVAQTLAVLQFVRAYQTHHFTQLKNRIWTERKGLVKKSTDGKIYQVLHAYSNYRSRGIVETWWTHEGIN